MAMNPIRNSIMNKRIKSIIEAKPTVVFVFLNKELTFLNF